MSSQQRAITFRLVFAALTLVAVGTQLQVTLSKHYGVVNFFSYFTNLSNIFASVVFIAGAVQLARGSSPSRLSAGIRGSSVVYMALVGIVFNLLLRGTDLGDLKPWVNFVVHLLMPIAVFIDWVAWPPRAEIALRTALLWLSFPAVYVAYSLIRGHITGFYPYPFFNPDAHNGYVSVAAYCVAMLVALLGLALLVRWIANRRGRTA